uniref:Neprosin PEP catalytic domain-containing protein n=1 Tax=Opuntia streptacantha TaxID=393608 RepID=A0A7C9AX84_OPUST
MQDDVTGNWWLRLGDDNIGYYPKELFTSLANGATAGGWGAEIYSSIVDAYPPMGSGHFPEEGYTKACFIRQMEMLDPSHSVIYPDKNSLQEYASLPKCYRVSNVGGQIMFVGGPPDCTCKGLLCQPYKDGFQFFHCCSISLSVS